MSARSALPRLAAAALLAALAHPAAASAACALRVGDAPADVRIAYDAFAAAATPVPLSLSLANDGDDECLADIRLLAVAGARVDAIAIGGTPVRVAIGPPGMRGGPSPGAWRVSVPPRSSTPVALEAAVVVDGVTPPGDTVATGALEVGVDAATVARVLPLRVVLASPARAQINVSGVDGGFGQGGTLSGVDLGVLEAGASRRLFLQLRANAATRLSLTSAGRGRLLPVDAENRSAEAYVPYGLRVDGEDVDLSASWERRLAPPRDLRGVSLPMDLTIGAAGGRPAGRYADVITIEASPL